MHVHFKILGSSSSGNAALLQAAGSSILIDAGYHPELNCGDVDMEGIEKIVSAYTPVPGGVGPMTINSLILNTVKSMEKRING